MSLRRAIYLGLVFATLAVYSAMVFWTLPTIVNEAGGLIPFDLRPKGYSFADAEIFLNTLSPDGQALYLGPQHGLDLIYPVLLAGFLAWSIMAQSTAIGGRLARALQVIGMIAAGLGMAFDQLENRAVSVMLTAQEHITPTMVTAASGWTVAKSVATAFAAIVLVGLLVWRGQRALLRR